MAHPNTSVELSLLQLTIVLALGFLVIPRVMNDKRDWDEGLFRCSDFLSLFLYL